MDLAIPAAKSGPCALTVIIIVEERIAGKTEKIPLIIDPTLERDTARAIKIPARIPLNAIFFAV
jgi:hypothetical protein